MARQIGTGHIHSLEGGALATGGLAGYVSPNMQSLRLTQNADTQRIKGQAGKTTGIICNDDILEVQVEVMPEGTTIANAKLSSGLPEAGTAFTMSGLPVIKVGPFADALNDAGVNPWIYEGGGQINIPNDAASTLSMTLRRYPQIASGAVIA